jgi:hypothetical protein
MPRRLARRKAAVIFGFDTRAARAGSGAKASSSRVSGASRSAKACSAAGKNSLASPRECPVAGRHAVTRGDPVVIGVPMPTYRAIGIRSVAIGSLPILVNHRVVGHAVRPDPTRLGVDAN